MKEPKKGDRVAIYGIDAFKYGNGMGRKTGVVESQYFGKLINVRVDDVLNNSQRIYHEKQLRKLGPPKIRREIWVNEYSYGLCEVFYTTQDEAIQRRGKDCKRTVHMREVKEKDGKLSHRIKEVWLFTSIDEKDCEGLVAFESQSGLMMPLVATDPARVNSLKGIAKKISKETGRVIKLSKFSVKEELGIIT